MALLLVAAVAVAFVWFLFRGGLTPKAQLTMMSARSGLSMDPGAKVTYNGVEIGRVATVNEVDVGGEPRAKITLDVESRYLDLIPRNVDASINATTVFGSKSIFFSSPKNPTPERITSSDVIDVTSATIEFNTLFETVVSVAQKVDPVELNQTLSAAAEALDGWGDRAGESLIHGDEILAELNPQMPQIRYDNQRLADLGETYANAASDLFDGLEHAVTTARTPNEQRGNIDQALLAAIGFGNTGGDNFERSWPYFVRAAQDLLPTSQLLDKQSPALFCTIRNYHHAEPKGSEILGGNGYSNDSRITLLGVSNPYVYPDDNLPRVNAKGGPEGRPGCRQPITRDLWPAPYLVIDTGAPIAPYNHFELGQPILIEYVWGRQIGENTINP